MPAKYDPLFSSRMLKPGGLYVSYEWVKTPKYDKRSPEHVRIVDAICYGDALPEMRTYLEIVDAAKEVGFDVLEERDLALPPSGPWWKRLKMGRLAYYRCGEAGFGLLVFGFITLHPRCCFRGCSKVTENTESTRYRHIPRILHHRLPVQHLGCRAKVPERRSCSLGSGDAVGTFRVHPSLSSDSSEGAAGLSQMGGCERLLLTLGTLEAVCWTSIQELRL